MALARTNTEVTYIYDGDTRTSDTVSYDHNATGSGQLLVLYLGYSTGTWDTITYGGEAPDQIICDFDSYIYDEYPGQPVPTCVVWNNPPSGVNDFVVEYNNTIYHSVLNAQSFTDGVIGNITRNYNIFNPIINVGPPFRHDEDYFSNIRLTYGSMIFTLGTYHNGNLWASHGTIIEGTSYYYLDGNVYNGDEPLDCLQAVAASVCWTALHPVALSRGTKTVTLVETSFEDPNDFIMVEILDGTNPIDPDPPTDATYNIGKLFVNILE